MSQPIKIQMEDIIRIRFPKSEVLPNPIAVRERDRNLENALSLGNNDHVKVKLTFLDFDNNTFMIETTIWAVTEESVCLKGDLLLPKRSLVSVEY